MSDYRGMFIFAAGMLGAITCSLHMWSQAIVVVGLCAIFEGLTWVYYNSKDRA